MNAVTVDAQNPWPGLAAYDEAASHWFKGRDDEADALLRLVQLAPLVALYGRSGLGKSSLLQAGLFPRLRAAGLLPVLLRIDHSAEAPDVPEQIARRLQQEAVEHGLQLTPRGEGESLWRWLHRLDFDVATADNWPLTPVLVLDQFEEIFSRADRAAGRMEAMLAALADLADNRIPAEVANDREAPRTLDLSRQRYRLLLSFREDFLPEMRAWERSLPSLLRNDLRLEPMRPAQAERAVQEAGQAVLAPGAAAAVVRFVGNLAQPSRRGPVSIEPVLLSLTCTQLNRRRGTALIDARLVAQVGGDILHDFYRDALADMPPAVHRFIETHLLQGERSRGSYALDEALAQGFITQAQLDLLTRQRRLLRVETPGDEARIELIHDRLVDVVRAARDRQAAAQAAEQAAAAAHEAERQQALERLAAEQAARAQAEQQARLRAEEGQQAQTLMAQAQADRALQAQADAARLRQSRRALQRALWVALALLGGVVLALTVAWRSSQEANVLRDKAEAVAKTERELRGRAETAERAARDSLAKAEAAQRRAEDKAAQVQLLAQYGWVRDASAGLNEAQVREAQAADQALTALLGQESAADRARRAATTLEIWAKDADENKVRGALQRLGFRMQDRQANVRALASNALWFGSAAHVDDVKLVALALMRAGVTIKAIRPLQREFANRDLPLVQVGADVAITNLPPYTVERLLATTRFVR